MNLPEPDSVEHHPAGYDKRERFENVEVLKRGEGGAVYSAEGEGAFWIVTDEGTMADFLPEDERDALIGLRRHDDRGKWEAATFRTRSVALASAFGAATSTAAPPTSGLVLRDRGTQRRTVPRPSSNPLRSPLVTSAVAK